MRAPVRRSVSIAAETVAQTILLNALVETGALDTLPAQVSGQPGKGAVTSAMAQRKVRQLAETYLAHVDTLRLTNAKNRSLKAARLVDGDWAPTPGRFELRNDGAFWATQAPGVSIRAVKAWGRTYVVQRSIGGVGTYYSHIARGQKTRSQGSLSPAWRARVGKKWLLANESPQSLNWVGAPAVEIAPVPGLSGYLLAQGALVDSVPFDATTSDTRGSMFLEIPLGFGRDLYDFEFTMQGGQEFLSFDSSVLRPEESVPDLSRGNNGVTIGALGLVEWYRVPAPSRVTVSSQSDWKLFDRDLSPISSGGATPATLQAPAGAYLAIFGPAGTTSTVVVD